MSLLTGGGYAIGEDSKSGGANASDNGQQQSKKSTIKIVPRFHVKPSEEGYIVPGLDMIFEGEPPKEERPRWFIRWKTKDDMNLASDKNTYRFPAPTVKELKEGRTLFQTLVEGYYLRTLNSSKLKWLNAGIRDIDEKQMNAWITSIELPNSRNNIVELRSIILGDNSFILILGREEIENITPVTRMITPLNSNMSKERKHIIGSPVIIFYYSDDLNHDPNVRSLFLDMDIMTQPYSVQR